MRHYPLQRTPTHGASRPELSACLKSLLLALSLISFSALLPPCVWCKVPRTLGSICLATRISELWCRAAMRALMWPSLTTLGLASCSKAICFHRCIFVVLSLTHSSQLNLFRSSSLTSSLFLPSRSSRKRLLLLADRSGACGTSRPSPLSFLDPPPLSL